MQLVQWVVPEPGGGFSTLFAPVWTEELVAGGARPRKLRRRSAPMTSRWLTTPLAIAEPEGVEPPRTAANLAAFRPLLHFSFATSDRGPPVALMRDDALTFASLYAEMVRVVADLCETASLPVLSVGPDAERRGLEVALGPLVLLPAAAAFDAVVLVRVAVEACAQARGFLVADATIRRTAGAAAVPLDARAGALFAEAE